MNYTENPKLTWSALNLQLSLLYNRNKLCYYEGMNCSFIAVRPSRYRGNRNGRQFFFMGKSRPPQQHSPT